MANHHPRQRNWPRHRLPWFVEPLKLILVATIVVTILFLATPEDTYARLTRSTKVISVAGNLYFLAAGLAFVVGAWITSRLPRRGPAQAHDSVDSPPLGLIRSVTVAGFIITFAAYAIWYILAIQASGGIGPLVAEYARAYGTSSIGELGRRRLEYVGGVTTLMQVGIPTTALATLWATSVREWRKSAPIFIATAVVVILALVRSLIRGERLAVIEVITPILVVLIYRHRHYFLRRQIVLPLVGVAVLYLFFTLAESLRSWTYEIYQQQYASVWSFALWRLASYYTTSLNNTVYLVDAGMGMATPIYFSLRWIWELPLYAEHLWPYGQIFDVDPYQVIERTLEGGVLTLEFNQFSTSGYLFLDFGYYGIAVSVLFGATAQLIFRGVQRGDWLWLVVYASLFVGLLEYQRIYYLFSGRQFPGVLFLLLVGLIRWSTRQPARGAHPRRTLARPKWTRPGYLQTDGMAAGPRYIPPRQT